MRENDSNTIRCLRRLEKSIVSVRSLTADGIRCATLIDGNSIRDYAQADYMRYKLIEKEIEKFQAALLHLLDVKKRV